MPKFDVSRLDALPADVRGRVEASLQETLEAEISADSGASGQETASRFSRSKGLIFSRSQVTTDDTVPTDVNIDAKVMGKIDLLDDAAFERFTSRLAALKGGST